MIKYGGSIQKSEWKKVSKVHRSKEARKQRSKRE
jgi:hypothetical protein